MTIVNSIRWILSLLIILSCSSQILIAQNMGFEAPTASPPTGWTAVTGTWTHNTNATFVRTGGNSMAITDPATSGTTIGASNNFITTSSSSFLITIAWGKSNSATNASFYLGYRSGASTNNLNPSSTTTPLPAPYVLNNSTWTRITSATAATVAAGSYGPALRAFRQTSTTGTTLYMDDFIVYSSASNVPDLTIPNPASGVTLAGTVLNWTNGTDNGAPASGIGGVIIVRAPGTGLAAPTLNDQAMYNPVNGTAGTGSFVSGGNTWTVVANITGSGTTTFNDGSGGPSNTYYVFMRDMAYNYSAGEPALSGPCTDPPTAGTPSANPNTVCANANSILSLTGGTGGIGQTFQWQSSLVSGGPYTNVGASSASPTLTVTSAVTTYYVCQVTCGSGTSQSAEVTITVTPAFPGGTYTINSNLATGGSNYQTFAAAISAMSNCGIAGPVVFNVDASSGPYTEQVIIPQIAGVSAVNTIIFNGNGRTITSASVDANNRHIIRLDGADYVTLNNLVLTSTGTYGWGVHFTNGADNNTVNGCTVNCNTTSTTLSDQHPIIFSGSGTTYNTAGVTGNNNTISNNTLHGGYYGVTMVGNAVGTEGLNNIVTNNIIREFYSYGVYVTFQRSGTIGGNDFSRPTRTTSTTASSVFLTTGCLNMLVEKNRVHNFFDAFTTSTSTFYGMAASTCDATAGEPNRFINNLVYDIRHNGIIYGIYNTGSDYVTAYHNTISLDYAAATAGTTYGVYQTTLATGLIYRNNNITIMRGGSGIKLGLNYSTGTSTITSNNNNVYVNSAGSGTQNFGGYGGTNYATLGLWQTNANGGIYDGASASADPLYVSPGTGDYTPTTLAIDNIGGAVGVTTDIMGASRSGSTPDVGAYEFTISSGDDIGALLLVTPATTGCFSDVQTVVVRVRNYGGPIDFSVSPATITCNITGAATATLTGTLTGTLATNATVDVALTGTFDMSTNGSYTFNAFTTCGSDGNATNNAMPAESRTRVAANGGTVASNQTTYCNSGAPTLTSTGTAGGPIQWQQSTVGTGGPWTNVGTGLTTYAPGTLTQTTYFRVEVTCLTVSAHSNAVTVNVSTPLVTGVTNGNLCGTGTVNLSAIPNSGNAINWYTAATGGTPVATGNNYTTPVISATTNYWVTATSGGSTSNVSKIAPEAGSAGTVLSTYGQDFTVTTGFTLNSVQVFSTTGTSITISLYSSGGTTQLLTTGAVAVTAGTSPIVNIGWAIAPGTYRLCANGMTGNFIRDNTGVTYPFALTGIGTMNGFVSSITGSVTTSSSYYFMYNWSVSTGCESTPRTQVTATVVPAPTISASTTQSLVCNGGNTTLNVTSSNPGYTYTWTPGNLTGSSVSVNPTATTTYTVTSLDISGGAFDGCTEISTVAITAQPASATISSSPEGFCVNGGSATLTLAPSTGYQAGSIQWQDSPNNTVFTDIGGATSPSYVTPSISASTYYKALIKDGVNNICLQPTYSLLINDPQVVSTAPGTRCGTGTVTLGATPSAGNTVNWYTAATGGLPVFTGSSFTTPVINNTTTYYAAGTSGGATYNTGMITPTVTQSSGTAINTQAMLFDALTNFTINSVVVYPNAAANGTAGTITLGLYNSAGTLLQQTTANVTGYVQSTTPTAETIMLNFNVTPGTNYKIAPIAKTGISGLMFLPSASAPSGNYGFPYTIPGVISVTSSALSGAVRLDLYYFFYNWSITTGCESSRQAVVATVTPAPAISLTSTYPAVCPGGSTDLLVTSANDPDYTYSWTSSPAGFTASGPGPHTVTPTVTTKYYVAALDNSGGANQGCALYDSITIVYGGTPVAGTISSSPDQLCSSGVTTLTSSGTSGGAFQWQQSSSASGPWTNVGSGGASYTSGTLTQTTYYRLEVGCQTLNDISNVVTVTVNNPTITGTTPDTRCGYGPVTLSATTSAGQVVWYNQPTGGAILSTGNNYSPSVNATTTYYAASKQTYVQSPISSGYTGGTTATDPNAAGNMFNVTALNTITVNSFDIHLNNDGNLAPSNISVYYKVGSYIGSTTTAAAWTLIGSATGIVSAGAGVPTALPVPINITIPAGQVYGFYIVVTNLGVANSLLYNSAATSPAEGAVVASDFNMQINSGTTVFGPFTGLPAAPINRKWNGRVNYTYDCVGSRTAVLATVTPSPAITATSGVPALCGGGNTTVSVSSSNDPDYTYSWTSAPAGFTASGAGPHNVAVPTSTTYTVTAIDNTAGPNTGCGAISTVTVNAAPNGIVLSASATPTSVCPGGNVQLNSLATVPPYTMSTSCNTSFIDINSTGTSIGTLADDGEFNITIPSFNFNGTNYTTARVGMNGVIVFGATAGEITLTNAALPTTTVAAGNTFLAPYWDDLDLNLGATVKTQTIGSVFIIQWTNTDHNLFTTGGITFQVQLNLTTGVVTYIYPDVTFGSATYNGGLTATVGIQLNSTTAFQYSFNTASLVDGQCISFTPNGTGALSYDWSTNSNFLTATNIANPQAQNITSAQTYTVVVTDGGSGCTKSQTVPITLKAAPDLSTSGGGVACEGNGISLSVSNNAAGQASGNSYAWTTDAAIPFTSTQQTPNVTGSSVAGHSGNYTVVVTNSFLCTSSAIEVVTVNPNPTLSIVSTQNVGCAGGSDGSITVGATGGLANYDFTSDFVNFINDPAQGTITNLPTGSTTIFVSDANGCNSQISASLTAISTVPPSAAVVVPFIGMPTNVCNGTTATLSIPAVSNTTMYIWDAPGAAYFNGNPLNVSPFTTSTPSVTVTYSNPSGSLYVTGVQAANGCGASLRKVQKTRGTISVPASVSGSTTACANTTGTYSTGAVDAASSYQWTITGDATVSGTGTTATVTFGAGWTGGTLCVAAKTSCYTSPTKCITIGTSASTLNAISGAFTACPNTTLSYSVPPSTGAASYTWTLPAGSTGSSTTNSISVTYGPGYSAAGSICVSVTSVCGVTSAIKCKTVAPGLPGQPSSITGALAGLCNQTVAYSCPSQGAGVTYNWTSPGSITSGQGSTSISTTFAALSTGNVCVTASNSCGSSLARCVPVKGAPNAPGAITATPSSWCANTPGIEFNVSTGSLTGSYTLSWAYPNASVVTYAFGGGNSTSLILDWISGSGAVNVTASNACGGATKPSTWSSTCREGETGTVSSMTVSPNPTTGVVNVNYTATKGSTVINVLDLAGRVVMTQATSSVEGVNTTQLDMSKLAKGAYMLSVQSTQGNKQIKVVVE